MGLPGLGRQQLLLLHLRLSVRVARQTIQHFLLLSKLFHLRVRLHGSADHDPRSLSHLLHRLSSVCADRLAHLLLFLRSFRGES